MTFAKHQLRRSADRVATWSPLILTSSTSTVSTLLFQRRHFDSQQRLDKEQGFGYRMKDIPVLTGNPRPVAREPGWTCPFKLSDRMEDVVPKILKQKGWTDEQVQREMSQMFFRKTHGSKASLNAWSTVEEFQRTPWYRRFKPTDDTAALFLSYEAMKLLETTLVPPSLRTDPYSHLRKRHMEDNWLNDKFSEESAKYIKKADLDKHTKGSEGYGTITRKKYMDFDSKFRKEHGGMPQVNEAYNSWLKSLN